MHKIPYSQKFSPTQQIDMEEKIAVMIYNVGGSEDYPLYDEDYNKLGKDILYEVLREFRTDLFDKK